MLTLFVNISKLFPNMLGHPEQNGTRDFYEFFHEFFDYFFRRTMILLNHLLKPLCWSLPMTAFSSNMICSDSSSTMHKNEKKKKNQLRLEYQRGLAVLDKRREVIWCACSSLYLSSHTRPASSWLTDLESIIQNKRSIGQLLLTSKQNWLLLFFWWNWSWRFFGRFFIFRFFSWNWILSSFLAKFNFSDFFREMEVDDFSVNFDFSDFSREIEVDNIL